MLRLPVPLPALLRTARRCRDPTSATFANGRNVGAISNNIQYTALDERVSAAMASVDEIDGGIASQRGLTCANRGYGVCDT